MAPRKKNSFRVTMDRPGVVACVTETFVDWLNRESCNGRIVVIIGGCFIRGPFRRAPHGLAAALFKKAMENEKLKEDATEVYMVYSESDAEIAQQLCAALMEIKEELKNSSANVKFMISNFDIEPTISWVLGDEFQFCESGKAIFTPPALPLDRLVREDTPFKVIIDSDALIPEEGKLTRPVHRQVFKASNKANTVTAWFSGKRKDHKVSFDYGP